MITSSLPGDTRILSPLREVARVMIGPANAKPISRAQVLDLAPNLAAIICQGELSVNAELLRRSPKLRIVASASVGVDKLDLLLLERLGVYATNAPDYFAEATADFTIGAIIALLRRLPEADRYVRTGRWKEFQPGAWDGALLRGRTLGLVGYGAIGQAVARRAAPFGLTVVHYRRTASRDPGYRPLDELLAISDIVSVHTPLNRESVGLIDARRLRRMKRGSYLINASRGQVVVEEALVRALASGRLAGAALDVFAHEPWVPSALRRAPNVLLTPHIAGGTREGRQHARLTCVQNVVLALKGQRPNNLQNRPAPRTVACRAYSS